VAVRVLQLVIDIASRVHVQAVVSTSHQTNGGCVRRIGMILANSIQMMVGDAIESWIMLSHALKRYSTPRPCCGGLS